MGFHKEKVTEMPAVTIFPNYYTDVWNSTIADWDYPADSITLPTELINMTSQDGHVTVSITLLDNINEVIARNVAKRLVWDPHRPTMEYSGLQEMKRTEMI